MKKYLLGIDIGTSACKLAVFDKFGNAVVSASAEYPVHYPQIGWAEQNPDDWWRGVCRAMHELWETVDPETIAAVGVDGQSWSAVAIDKNGEVLCPTPIWMDTRSRLECERAAKEIGEEKLFALSGNALSPTYSTGKVLWMKAHTPDIFAETEYILQSNSYIVYRLTEKVSHDLSQGYAFSCFDMKKLCWDLDMAKALGIPETILPSLFRSDEIVGTVTEKASLLTELPIGTPVVAGGLDAACATLGAGVIKVGQTQEQGGTSEGMSICIDEPRSDKCLILCPHVVPGLWLLQGGTTGGGGVMRWLSRELGESENASFKRLDELAATVPAGSDGVIFLPYMAGERSPIWDADAKGIFYGLDFSKTRAHLIRSALEGVAFSLRHNIDVAESAGVKVGEMQATGGSANSRLWTQIKADVTQKTIIVSSSDNSTTWGAAILAGIGVGMFESYEEAVSLSVKELRRHEPNPETSEAYDKSYKTYLSLYPALKSIKE